MVLGLSSVSVARKVIHFPMEYSVGGPRSCGYWRKPLVAPHAGGVSSVCGLCEGVVSELSLPPGQILEGRGSHLVRVTLASCTDSKGKKREASECRSDPGSVLALRDKASASTFWTPGMCEA